MPLQFTTEFTCQALHIQQKAMFADVFNFLLFLFVFFCNKYYNAFYALISGNLPFVFWIIADAIPLFLLLMPTPKKEKNHA